MTNKTGDVTKNGNHVVIHLPGDNRRDFTMPKADRGSIITNHKGGHSPAVSTGKRHFQRKIIRKNKGTSVGGQFAVDPNGPASKARQNDLLGKHPEKEIMNTAKRHKKEAMDRFLAKQKAEKEANHLIGLPGPVTKKKLAKEVALGNVPGAQLRNKLRKLERIAHAQGRPGFATLAKRFPNGDVLEELKAIPIVPIGPKSGDRQVDTTAHHDRVFHNGEWLTEKGFATLRREKHERHVAERLRKKAEEFRLGKNIAAKRHNAKVKGKPFETPIGPQVGARDASGKFQAIVKRGKHDNKLQDSKGQTKVTWLLVPTELRGIGGNNVQVQQPHQWKPVQVVNNNIQAGIKKYPNAITTPLNIETTPDGLPIRRASSGIVTEALPNVEQGHGGAFVSEKEHIQGDGRAILKSDSFDEAVWGGDEPRGIAGGFAYRETATYNIDKLLGLNIVPETEPFVCRTNPLEATHGEYHSIQHYVTGANVGDGATLPDTNEGYVNSMTDKTEVGKIVLLDTILGNTDRHGYNWMYSIKSNGEKHIHAIDNGLQMTSTTTNVKDIIGESKFYGMISAAKNADGKLPLGSQYKVGLQRALGDGSFEKIVRDVQGHTYVHQSKHINNPQKYADATIARAYNIIQDWDNIFAAA